jgi:phage terminase large subunit
MTVLEQARAKITTWRQSPTRFVMDQFGVEPDAWQRHALDLFPSQDPDKLRIALQACAGPGKTAVLAWCGLNFLSCYAGIGEHPKGIAVSVTADNLKDNLWPEFAKWMQRSAFLTKAFTWTKERIFAKDHPETWMLSARSWSKTADAEEQGRTLSGTHAKYVLYLLDESGDISPAVLRAAEQGLSNCAWGKIVQAGNPTSHDGMLYLAATSQRHLWSVIRITGDPDDPNRSPRINLDWAKEQIAQYGRENPWVKAYILGEFPPASINALLGVDEVEAAMSRHLREDQYDFSQKRLGIDVARFGDDRTVIFPRQGLAALQPTELRNARSHEIAAAIAKAKERFGSEMELVDDTGGYGAGVIDALLQGGLSPIPVNFGGKAINPRYFNARSEMWFGLADWIRRGGALPKSPTLVRELTTPTYTFHWGRFQLEEKDQIKKRLGFSPDYADALACTFALPDQPAYHRLPWEQKANTIQHDYDPFAEART